jgi:hypothetical protein
VEPGRVVRADCVSQNPISVFATKSWFCKQIVFWLVKKKKEQEIEKKKYTKERHKTLWLQLLVSSDTKLGIGLV